jgi:chemotaxis protein methyltransferase CheR
MTQPIAAPQPATSLALPDFNYIRTLAKDRAALVIEDGKEYLVEARLSPIARKEGFQSLQDLIGHLRGQSYSALHRKVVEAMTINETSFFRDWRPYEALRKAILPDVLQKRAATKQLNIWSMACSSGQEPYSVAILLREYFPQLYNWQVRIFATDVSLEMIEKAKTGRYAQLETNRGLPAPLLIKYFIREGLEWQLKDDLRKMVEFQPCNLAGDWPQLPRMDLVLLRNVMIYFDVPTKQKILGKVRVLLREQGILFLGAAETTLNLDNNYERATIEGTTCYRVP